MTIDFKGAHYPKAVIVHAVLFYVRYAVSYRDLEEILADRGVAVDHATLNRWVVKYSPLIAANAQARKGSVANLRQNPIGWQHLIRPKNRSRHLKI
jgi:putative transposase